MPVLQPSLAHEIHPRWGRGSGGEGDNERGSSLSTGRKFSHDMYRDIIINWQKSPNTATFERFQQMSLEKLT